MMMKKQHQMTYTPSEVANVCDHTFLKRTEEYKKEVSVGESPVRKRESVLYKFLESACQLTLKPYAICIRAEDVPHTVKFFEKHRLRPLPIVATVGFPEGHWYKPNYKLFEAQYAMSEGAKEIDMVLNYQAMKEGDHSAVLQEVQNVAKVVHRQQGKLKLILETSELSNFQISQACHIATHAGVDFVKTSTGFGAYGAHPGHLKVICENFYGGIKISGGINIDNIQHFLEILYNYRGDQFALNADCFRIGESQLLMQLLTAHV